MLDGELIYVPLNPTDEEFEIFLNAISLNPICENPLLVSKIDNYRYRYVCYPTVDSGLPVDLITIEIYRPREGDPYISRIYPSHNFN